MGKLTVKFPDDLVKEISNLSNNSHQMFREMVEAGREVLYKNVLNNIPTSLKNSDFRNNVTKTTTYYTSDGATNAGVVISGYFTNEDGKKTPAPLVANMFEYGSDIRHYPKQPFVRKSLKRKEMLEAAKKVEDKYI